MRTRIFILTSFLAMAVAAVAQGNFISVGGYGAGCTFSVENAVSGYTVDADGAMFSHGANPLSSMASLGVEDMTFDPADGPVIIYTIDGRMVNSNSLENLDPGIYVVCQGTNKYKYIKSAR